MKDHLIQFLILEKIKTAIEFKVDDKENLIDYLELLLEQLKGE